MSIPSIQTPVTLPQSIQSPVRDSKVADSEIPFADMVRPAI